MIRNHYPELFEDDTEFLELTNDVASRTYEFTEYVNRLMREGTYKVDISTRDSEDIPKVTYHEACHLSRDLGVKEGPRNILRALEGLEFVEMSKPEVCCGFGGVFSIKFANISSAMMMEKVDSIE